MGTSSSQKAQERSARKNRQFQSKFYKTRYQNTMQDMKLAGMNPMLAYSQGVQGGVPAGGVANISDSMSSAASMINAGASGVSAGAAHSQAMSARGLRSVQGKLMGQQLATESARTLSQRLDAVGKSLDNQHNRYGLPKAKLGAELYGIADGKVPSIIKSGGGEIGGLLRDALLGIKDAWSAKEVKPPMVGPGLERPKVHTAPKYNRKDVPKGRRRW